MNTSFRRRVPSEPPKRYRQFMGKGKASVNSRAAAGAGIATMRDGRGDRLRQDISERGCWCVQPSPLTDRIQIAEIERQPEGLEMGAATRFAKR